MPNGHNGGGRERLRDTETIIEALRASGGIISIAAQKLKVHRQRVHEWIEEDPAIKAAVAEIRNEVLDLAEAKLIEAIRDGSEKSVHFYLDRIGRDRGYGNKTMIAGVPGEPVSVQAVPPDLSRLTQSERDALRSVAERLAGQSEGDA